MLNKKPNKNEINKNKPNEKSMFYNINYNISFLF